MRRALAALAAGTLLVAAAPAAQAATATPVTDWIMRNATPIRLDPGAPLDDLTALAPIVGRAPIVGLGESTHGGSEETKLKHRVLRYLVEKLGFRSIAWEEDWTVGLEVDAFIRTGAGGLGKVMRKMSDTWQSREVAGVIQWLREYNATHEDQVRFVGVDFFSTGPAAYDAVRKYVSKVAPERLKAADRHLKAIRPNTTDMAKYVEWYYALKNKQPYIQHARRLYDLVAKVSKGLALHHARQIRSFYEYYDRKDLNDYRDARAAENLRWWRGRSGDKMAYWAASPHTAAAPGLTYTAPSGALSFDPAGSHLRRWYGERYRSIGFTFDHGKLPAENGKPAAIPSPPREWADAPFGQVSRQRYLLDLRADASPSVRGWLRAPAKMRVVAGYDPARPQDHHMTGASLSRWFDAIVHTQVISPRTPL